MLYDATPYNTLYCTIRHHVLHHVLHRITPCTTLYNTGINMVMLSGDIGVEG